MYTYTLRDRLLQYKALPLPTFPADVVVSVHLMPLVPFGGTPGRTRTATPEIDMKLRVNVSTGQAALEAVTPLFDPLNASIKVLDTDFSIARNIVTVRSRCASQQDLTDLIAAVFYALPATLNVYIADVPFATHAWGTVGSNEFQWNFEPSELLVQTIVSKSRENQEELVTNAWKQVVLLAASRRLSAAAYYFHVGCRLLTAGYNRFEFMADALLNFAKALQAAFGDRRDTVREELRKLNAYTDAEIEGKFLSALFLRSEFDVAHVSLGFLNRKQLRVLHDYTNIAEHSLRNLLQKLFERVASKQYVMLSDTPMDLSQDKQEILDRLETNIAPFIGK